jgi:hypothetical protein
VAVACAEAQQVEAEVDGGIFSNTGQVYAVGAAAVQVEGAGDAVGGILGAVGLQVEECIGAGDNQRLGGCCLPAKSNG